MKLSEAVRILESAGIDNPRHDARRIFEHIGKIPKPELFFFDAECDSPDVICAIERRRSREPLQYVLEEADFYRESYYVNKSCLIPRSDTEILVDFAVSNLPAGSRFLDLCTGSGCVAISTLRNTKSTSAVAVDISGDALSIAKRNAERNSVSERVRFVKADALSASDFGKFFAVLSNPPYVSNSAYEKLEPEIYFEPQIAFVGGEDGLDFYEKIIELYIDKLEEGGFFAFEIGFDQAEALKKLAIKHGLSCEIIKDYSNNDRVAVLRMA